MIMLIREVLPREIDAAFLWEFDNYQSYHRIWEKAGGQWSLKDVSVVRQWDSEKKLWMARYLRRLVEEEGGCVLGAFVEGKLAGFLALGGVVIGSYRNLSLLFVDSRYRRHGVGRNLFEEGVKKAAAMGGEKLFISSIPSEETVAFYFSLGCRDAEKPVEEFVDMPFDRCMEYTLNNEKETR